MLKIDLVNTRAFKKSYNQIIDHLAFNTRNHYQLQIISQSDGKQNVDINQVCCSMCEKPLTNGMRMFYAPKEGDVKIFMEPTTNQSIPDQDFEEFWSESYGENLESLLLLCGDCARAFESSYRNFHWSGEIIKRNGSPVQTDVQLLDTSLYVFPNHNILWNELEHKIVEVNSMEESNEIIEITSDDCFIYKKQVAWVKNIVQEDGLDEFTVIDESFESMVFVEPNPSLPQQIRVRALNTIRLFKLNGLYYNYQESRYHQIIYIRNDNHTKFDDLKLIGRSKAFKRAQTALSQFRNARDLFADKDLMVILTEQQKIIMELNGYRSTWAEVFNSGDDPEGLSDLFGLPTPIPTAPKVTFDEYEVSEVNRLKDQLVDLENKQQAAESIYREMQKNIDALAYENQILADQISQYALNREELLEFINDLVITIDDYEGIKFMGKKREIKLARKKGIIEKVIRPVKSSSRVLRGVRNKMVNVLNHQVTLVN